MYEKKYLKNLEKIIKKLQKYKKKIEKPQKIRNRENCTITQYWAEAPCLLFVKDFIVLRFKFYAL